MKNSEIKIKMPINVKKILSILYFEGCAGYIVGGCVRDSILGLVPNDWDICTNCVPGEMLHIFSPFKVILTGFKHGTVTVVIGGENYEITTYRIDGDYIDGRHPEEVIFTDKLKEDLRRRDFTINAMAYNDRVGLIDYYGGVQDILDKKIRCVGDPVERFKEDYLRMLRGVRLATQLEYNLESGTFDAIKELCGNIVNISAERIREELNEILLSRTPSVGFRLLDVTGLLKYIMPELETCVGFEQHNPCHHEDVFNHTLSVVDNTESDLILRLAALFHDIGKPETFVLDARGRGRFYNHSVIGAEIAEDIMKRLRYDSRSIEQVAILVKEHMSRYENLSDKAMKRFINRVGRDNIDRLFKLQIADIEAIAEEDEIDVSGILKLKGEVKKILDEKQPLSVKDLEVDGYNLMELGIPEGKQIGTILTELLEIVLENPETNKKDILMKLAKDKL
ncbi:MAG TPA: CCA tRNA nucleotidyltransferase [Clostridia bacterium]|nr:CCA tRNA nucleotidyltransferase [Clostridia bacterium]